MKNSLTVYRPYIISWNLTYRCNLACEHCYLDAGARKFRQETTQAFADRSELSTQECFSVIDQISQFAPEAITILTGGEPLLRRDILEIARYGSQKGLMVVVGTNGVLITENLAHLLKESGVRGLALSLDALDPEVHDRFRKVQGAWENTVHGAKVLDTLGLPFIVQTTVGKHNSGAIEEIADFAYGKMKAKVFNLYFLVPTGRGPFVSDITPEQYNGILKTLSEIQKKFDGKMIVNAKCAPHYARYLYEKDPQSKFLKAFAGGAGGCPAGTHYMGIRPNGDMTPCPYLPLFGGNLKDEKMADIWDKSDLFTQIRNRNHLGGRCGDCEFGGSCGGCRARAFGVTGNFLDEDPLCDYQPGKFSKEEISLGTSLKYGIPYSNAAPSIHWDEEALARVKQIPAFVRGMVQRSVESHCKREGIPKVTLEVLAEIRDRMPTAKIFSKKSDL